MKAENQYKYWTQEEIDYLTFAYTYDVPFDEIVKHLKRTSVGVERKVVELHLQRSYHNDKFITLGRLVSILGRMADVSADTLRQKGLPIKTIKPRKTVYKIVYIDDFWQWARANSYYIDFSRLEEGALGKEPEWVAEKRERDKLHQEQCKVKVEWSAQEEQELVRLVSMQKYNNREIARKLKRTEGAISYKKHRLGIDGGTIQTDTHRLWEEYEIQITKNMIAAGYYAEDIADELNRTANAVKAKVLKLYGTQDFDRVRTEFCKGANK